ncbi:hypothetical protein LO762_18905 [Actinocorallia sp. API 0066]|uniref:hypothetical protein n=1 Tax=Actinocorallia sp. API 0066 TaxID=2896846 RepID=UPI001E46F88D|nr:hypothetical protein [Actinocorallia sp. API 0066]MCD0451251.1 hypothetical protein [Actinocorallia sp. API 0066]
MDRRTDRTVGLVTIIAMAAVPAAVLGLVRVDASFDGGAPSDVAITPVSEDYPGAPKRPPKAETVEIVLPPAPATPTMPKPEIPGESGPLPAQLTSFTRYTGTVTFLPDGSEQTQEEAHFTLKPRFTMKATSVKSRLVGQKWRKVSTTVITIKNGVQTTKVGKQPAEREQLTPEQVAELKRQADPRFITRQIKRLPGVHTRYDKKTKLYKHSLDLTAGGNFLQYLPEDIGGLIPAGAELLGVKIEGLSDAKDHSVIASFNGASTVGAIGVGVVHTNMR